MYLLAIHADAIFLGAVGGPVRFSNSLVAPCKVAGIDESLEMEYWPCTA